MADISLDLQFSFDELPSPLDVSLSDSSDSQLDFTCTYDNTYLTITYDLTQDSANARWTASDNQRLTVGEIMHFIGLGSLATSDDFNDDLTALELNYQGDTGLAVIDLHMSSGDKAFLAAIKIGGKASGATNASQTGTQQPGWHYAFGLYLTNTLSTAQLPLVGPTLGNKISAKDLSLVYLSEGIDQHALDTLNTYLTSVDIPLPSSAATGAIPTGLIANATLNFDNILPSFTLSSTQASANSDTQHNTQHNTQSSNAASSSSQKTVGHNIGPVHIQSIKLGFDDGDISLLTNAAIALGPLSMSLQGLQISNPMDCFDPQFDLDGLGINYNSGPLQLGGDFLKVLPTPDNVKTQYDGALTLGLDVFQLNAYGSYATLDNGDASFFIYAVADYPLGGPAFFFVTGLAAAFGYNRTLITPPVSHVSQFPLVKAAATPASTGGTSDLAARTATILSEMNADMPAQAGEFFAGLGIKFDSFKIINGFALLLGKFGKELEFDLFALINYTAPTPSDPNPVAVVELEVLGRLIPSEGSLLVQGQLTPNSFLLDKNCHLTGGFAVGFWATGPYAGDFVYTFGGYGSHYTPPAHYPQHVPVVGLNWQIDSHMSVKGGLYWAITPQIIAAGGYLKANFSASFFRAWFSLDAYFLIHWKPFYYEAGFHVDFGLKVKVDLLFTSVWLGFDMSASLAIKGPPFGGRAKVSLSVCTIHIDFGASASSPPPLSWSQFDSAFLPAKPSNPSTADQASANRVMINLVSGLVKTTTDQDQREVWVINATELCLETHTVIPSTDYVLTYQETKVGDANATPGASVISSPKTDFTKPGITPMGVASGGFTAQHKITLTGPDDTCLLKAVPVLTNAPKAIWGGSASASNTSSSNSALVSNTLSGFKLIPAQEPTPGVTHSVSRNSLAWELLPTPQAYQDATLSAFSGASATRVDQYIAGSETARAAVLTAMGLAADIPDSTTLQQNLNFTFTPALINGNYGTPA